MSMKRPEHPDFWTLSRILIDTDSQLDNKTARMDEIVNRIIPMDVLVYIAQQRALRMANAGVLPKSMEPAVASGWLDGFMAGAQFQATKSQGTWLTAHRPAVSPAAAGSVPSEALPVSPASS